MEESNNSDIDQRVRQTLSRVFQLSPDEVAGDVRMGSNPRWDSMGHMQLLMELEREFDVTFPTYEIAELLSIDAINKAVEKYSQNSVAS